MRPVTKGGLALFNGLFGVILALLLWRLTRNWYAWAVLFYPASVIILWGCYRVFVLDDT